MINHWLVSLRYPQIALNCIRQTLSDLGSDVILLCKIRKLGKPIFPELEFAQETGLKFYYTKQPPNEGEMKPWNIYVDRENYSLEY